MFLGPFEVDFSIAAKISSLWVNLATLGAPNDALHILDPTPRPRPARALVAQSFPKVRTVPRSRPKVKQRSAPSPKPRGRARPWPQGRPPPRGRPRPRRKVSQKATTSTTTFPLVWLPFEASGHHGRFISKRIAIQVLPNSFYSESVDLRGLARAQVVRMGLPRPQSSFQQSTWSAMQRITTQAVHKGSAKWTGMVAMGVRLSAAPHHAPFVLMVETLAGVVHGNSADTICKGNPKWDGITAWAPSSLPLLLMLQCCWWLRPWQG